jgi:hypothetical protein
MSSTPSEASIALVRRRLRAIAQGRYQLVVEWQSRGALADQGSLDLPHLRRLSGLDQRQNAGSFYQDI